MALQYPSLFPYGYLGFNLGIQYNDAHILDEKARKTLAMLGISAIICLQKFSNANYARVFSEYYTVKLIIAANLECYIFVTIFGGAEIMEK
jgi:hypothetical protein